MIVPRKKSRKQKKYSHTFRIVYEGKSLSNQFSQQRKWLNNTFESCASYDDKKEFVHRLSNLTQYWTDLKNCESTPLDLLHKIHHSESDLVALCLKYLDDSNHRMSDTVISRFYSSVLRGVVDSELEFFKSIKATAAFFTLWRSAYSNTGLDDIYKKLFSSDNINLSWNGNPDDLTSKKLKDYYISALKDKDIFSKPEWLEKSKKNLDYLSAKTVCNFILLLSSHDTIPDTDNLGLAIKGRPGCSEYLKLENWKSEDLKTIEHIAPQKDEGGNWDKNIYLSQLENSIGNLTLLPLDINSCASNKSLDEKMIYYKNLSLKKLETVEELRKKATHKGFKLSDNAIKLLNNSKHANHIKSIVMRYDNGDQYDSEFIKSRAERTCSLAWDIIIKWLK